MYSLSTPLRDVWRGDAALGRLPDKVWRVSEYKSTFRATLSSMHAYIGGISHRYHAAGVQAARTSQSILRIKLERGSYRFFHESFRHITSVQCNLSTLA